MYQLLLTSFFATYMLAYVYTAPTVSSIQVRCSNPLKCPAAEVPCFTQVYSLNYSLCGQLPCSVPRGGRVTTATDIRPPARLTKNPAPNDTLMPAI
jgi:hypothetical protein